MEYFLCCFISHVLLSDITGNMSSHQDNNQPHSSNKNVPRGPNFEFHQDYAYINNQHNCKEITRPFSSFVVSAVVFLSIVYSIWNSQLSIFNVLPLYKEHDGRHSIWPSLLELFAFMVFVCAVSVMILVGAAFTNMQKAMIILWLMLLHLQSSNSISEVFGTLAAGLFMVWYAFGKSNHQMK
jgi:hypothetical protein